MTTNSVFSKELAALSEISDAVRSGQTTQEAIRTALAEYPQHALLITDYALQTVPLGIDEQDASDSTIAPSVATASLIDRIAAKKQQQMRPTAIKSLLTLAISKLGSPAKLSEMLGLGHSVLVKLDRGLIEFATIPAEFIERSADQLRVSRNALETYLRLPPRLANSSDYRARKRPSPGAQQTFADAINASVIMGEMNEDAARVWQHSTDL